MNPYAPSSSKHPPDEPITRSRTLFYLSVRDSSSFGTNRGPRLAAAQYGDTVDVEDDERGGLLGSHSTHVDMHGLPPKWVDVNDEVEDILERVKGKVATLDKLHAKHVMPSFTDRSAEEREIERQTADITRDFRRCSNLIASIAPGRGAPRVEAMTSKNVQRGLAQKVQEASALFRKKQRVYMQKLQGHAVKNKDLLAASGAITLRGTDSLDALDEDEEASRNQLQSQSTTTMTVDTNIEQRSKEITQIASSISELADLFRDLGNLVVEQGTVLDSVEYNVQQTSKNLSDAVEELNVARTYQRNTGKRKCILLLILLIILMIVILIYKPRGHGGSNKGEDGEKEGEDSSSQSATLSGGSSFLLPTTYRVAAVDVTSAISTTSSPHSASSTITPQTSKEAGHRLPGLGSQQSTSKAARPKPSLLTQGGGSAGGEFEEYAEDEYWDDDDDDDERRAWRQW